ncbi:MAG TPA: hypothetical protein VF131_16530 [Blastocatellia bacterium]|nr:hypothetical protein [Blastocatellia bacterium]
MIKKISRLLTIVTLLGIAFVSAGWFLGGAQSQHRQSKDVDVLSGVPQKSLREIARERDVEFESFPEIAEFNDLSSLARSSKVIVLGRIIKAESEFTKSGHDIETIYSVDVQQVLKSDSRVEFPLRFVNYGGTVYSNGHKATVKVKGIEALKIGNDYIFFLALNSNSDRYVLEGGMSSVFRVKDNARVYSLASHDENKLRLNYNGTDLQEFINQLLTLR